MEFFFYFTTTFVLSLAVTWAVRRAMMKWGIVDKPGKLKRKIHESAKPLGGGLAIFISFFAVLYFAYNYFGDIGSSLSPSYLLALFLGGCVLMMGGILDDIYDFNPAHQIWFPIVATITILAFGIGPEVLTNPIGDTFNLHNFKLNFSAVGEWLWLSDLIVFFWLMGMMFTTKLLDGLDGLVSGIVTIGALMIFFLSTQTQWYQPEMAILSIIFAGACLGFLVWNWHPAKIFLGESGSLFTGYVLGVLAIIAGGKIATALLVMGVPIIDIIRVVIRRYQKNKPLFVGDNEHLHFKLVDSGFSQRQTALLFYTISLLFGVTTLFLQSSQKMIALLFLLVLMLVIGVWFSHKETKQSKNES